MAEFQKVIKERKRMCKDQSSCKTCPIYSANCYEWTIKNPELAEERIIQWAAEHPIVTNSMKFREVFGQPYEQWFAVTGVEAQWLSAEYKGGQDNGSDRH